MADDEFEEIARAPLSRPDNYRTRLGAAWRKSTALKIVSVLVIAVGGAAILSLVLGGGDKPPTQTANITPPIAPTGPRGQSGSPLYNEQVKKADNDRYAEAVKTGGSNAVAPEIPAKTAPTGTADDPLSRYKTDADKTKAADADKKDRAQPTVDQAYQNRKAALQKQFASLSKGWDITGPLSISAHKTADGATDGTATGKTDEKGGGSTGSKSKTGTGTVIEEANAVRAGILRYVATSDVKVPIVADIQSGPMKGGTLNGSYQVTNEQMLLHFDTAHFNKHDYEVDAYALDPDTESFALQDDVNHHLLSSLVLPAAAAFVSSLGSTLASPNTTVSVNGSTVVAQTPARSVKDGLYAGAGAAASQLSSILSKQASGRETTVTVNAKRPIAIAFMKPVVEKD